MRMEIRVKDQAEELGKGQIPDQGILRTDWVEHF